MPFFVNLDDASIWDANEAYYVETPREMIESGDYINPSFNYEPRFNKPVLSYWIVAGLYRVFGVSVAVERAAIAGAAMIMIDRRCGSSRAPRRPSRWRRCWPPLGLAAGPRFFMFSRRIFVDMAVTAMMTLTLLFFVLAERYPVAAAAVSRADVRVGRPRRADQGPGRRGHSRSRVHRLSRRVHRELGRLREMMIPAGALIALAIVAPWYVALYLQHGWTYITGFFIGENVGRFTETIGVQARARSSTFLSCSATRFPGRCVSSRRHDLVGGSARRAEPASVRIRTLLLLWIAIIVVFFSLSQTKQDLYIFPIVAAVAAALGGDWVAAWPARRSRSRMDRGHVDRVRRRDERPRCRRAAICSAATHGLRIDGARAAAMIAIVGGLVVAILPWLPPLRGGRLALHSSCFIAFNWILACARCRTSNATSRWFR